MPETPAEQTKMFRFMEDTLLEHDTFASPVSWAGASVPGEHLYLGVKGDLAMGGEGTGLTAVCAQWEMVRPFLRTGVGGALGL